MAGWLDDCVDAIVTDPPYELGFMGKAWDRSGIAYSVELWREALRVLKPGGHLLAFGGSRTYHRLACAVEDAGFEIRDQIMWIYGSGFPKSLDVSKAIDKAAGVEREVVGIRTDGRGASPSKIANHGPGDTGIGHADGSKQTYYETGPSTESAKVWQGWGTALKPAHEPIVVARKPLIGTVAENVLKHGTGAINVDGCRVGVGNEIISTPQSNPAKRTGVVGTNLGISRSDVSKFQEAQKASAERTQNLGRWPANVIHDGSEEVLEGFPQTAPSKMAPRGGTNPNPMDWGHDRPDGHVPKGHNDNGGSAARFFYCAKASKTERGEGNTHPTVKPTDLMRYMCRLVTPPGGIILDPFAGSGSICRAAYMDGFKYIGVEIDANYCRIANGRLNLITAGLPICAALNKLEEGEE